MRAGAVRLWAGSSTGRSSGVHAMNTRRLRGDGQLCRPGIGVGLEGNQVIGIVLHLGEPVDNEFTGLPPGETQLGEGVFQEGGGVVSRYAEAL